MPGLLAADAMEESPQAVPVSPMVKSIKSESENKSPRSPLSPKSPRGTKESPSNIPLEATKNSFVNNQTGNGGANGTAATATTSTSTSIEQLYENVCQMKSSGDQSPSRPSSTEQSEVEEFRIDSELQQLAGGENAVQNNSSVERQKHVKQQEEEKPIKEGKKLIKEGKEKPQKEKIVSNGVKSAPQGKEVQSEVKKNSSAEKNKAGQEKPIRAVSSVQPKRPPRLQVSPDVPTKTSPSNKGISGKMTPTKSPANQQSKSPHETSERNPNEDSPVTTQRKLFQSPDKPPRKVSPAPMRKKRLSPVGLGKIHQESDETPEVGLENPDLGPFLLKLARNLIASGDNPYKALECAIRASKSFEICADGKPSLELVMSLHILAAIHCSLGQYEQAIPVLERSIEVPVLEEGQEHALAAFAGHMQLGDTYAMLGQLERSIECYKSGLQIQKQVLGEMDPRVGETCRYLAEAHVQAMQFDEAEKLCQHSLDIHKEHSTPASLEEAADRRLMALIYDGKGDHEAALEHLVLASMAMISNGQEMEVASVDCSIGDTYLALGRYDEAVFAYQKSLTVFKSTKGENHPSVAAVFVRLADLYYKTGKLRESKTYCENALRIYGRPIVGHPADDIASGLTEVSAIYEAMNEPEQALRLLQRALKILDDAPGQQSTVAGIQAQMGVIYYVLGKYGESHASFNSAVTKLRASGEKKSAFFAIVLNQMGLACVQRYAINEAADLFEEARSILEEVCGPYHPDTLAVYSNLAGTYDAMGRLEDAIGVLEYIVGAREEKLGTANPDVDDEKKRLAELLKEAGRARNRKAKSLETLLQTNSHKKKKEKAK